MTFWIVFNIWAKTKQTKQKLGKSVHFSAYDNFNFLWLTRIIIVHILVKNEPIFTIFFCLLCFYLNIKNDTNHHYFFLFWLVLSFPKVYLKVRFWNFEDKLQLMETLSGQNLNIFEISAWKQASRVIFCSYQ